MVVRINMKPAGPLQIHKSQGKNFRNFIAEILQTKIYLLVATLLETIFCNGKLWGNSPQLPLFCGAVSCVVRG